MGGGGGISESRLYIETNFTCSDYTNIFFEIWFKTSNYIEMQVWVKQHASAVDKDSISIRDSPPNEHTLRSSLIWQSCVLTS